MRASRTRSSPQLDHLQNKSVTPRKRRRRDQHPLRRLDPIRASRLRLLLERLVIAALDLPGSGLPRPAVETLSLGRPDRGAITSLARQVAMYLAHVGCALTLTEAAWIYGRNRTTAAHACAVVERRRDDPRFDRVMAVLEHAVRLGFAQIEPSAVSGWAAH